MLWITTASLLVWVFAAFRALTEVGPETLFITIPTILALALYARHTTKKEPQ